MVVVVVVLVVVVLVVVVVVVATGLPLVVYTVGLVWYQKVICPVINYHFVLP